MYSPLNSIFSKSQFRLVDHPPGFDPPLTRACTGPDPVGARGVAPQRETPSIPLIRGTKHRNDIRSVLAGHSIRKVFDLDRIHRVREREAEDAGVEVEFGVQRAGDVGSVAEAVLLTREQQVRDR